MSGFDDRNVIGLIQSAVEERFAGSWAADLAFVNTASSSEIEKYGIFGGYAKMREWVGARQAQTIGQKNYEIRNRKFESSLVVPNDMRNRDKSGLLDTHINGWVDGTVNYHWEDLLVDLINAGGAQTCFDGQYFFDTDHQFGDETAQKNSVTASDVTALNVGTATAPTPSEIASAIMGLVGYMLTFTDDKGRYINGNGRMFTVQVSTVDLWTSLMTAINSNILTGIVDNPLNGLTLGGFKFKPLFSPELTSATAKIRVYRTDGARKAFILQEERGLQFKSKAEGSDFEYDNDAIEIGVQANRGAGYGDWKSAIEGTLS